jgi:isocitrate dehydrogenase
MSSTSENASQTAIPITVARGDGIGPEIMDATLKILEASGAKLAVEEIEIGEQVYKQGFETGIKPEAWDSLRRTKVFLKAPITTPQGGGFKSLNVTIRKALGLFANVRPCVAYHPFVATKHPGMDVVIVRENEEDTYAGIEHRQTEQVMQCLKLISRPGCERIVRYAFEYARSYGRKKVTCFSKDNIMKLTDGLFHKVFDEIAPDYPEIENEHWIVDIGAAKLADTPEQFDVVVMANLYGDILSDVAAQIAGSVGLAGSANVGQSCSMFEAIHGSAPRRAGQNLANPSGLLQGAIQMLVHIGQNEVASRVQNAFAKTLEDGIHTYDVYKEGVSSQKVGTAEFAQAIIGNLGQQPKQLPVAAYADRPMPIESIVRPSSVPPSVRTLEGMDLFLCDAQQPADVLATRLQAVAGTQLKLKMITNRGVKVWPDGLPETFCTDHWRCRFIAATSDAVTPGDLTSLAHRAVEAGLDVIKTENLYNFDGQPGYSVALG